MGTRASTWHRDLHQPVPFIVLAASFISLLRLQTKIAVPHSRRHKYQPWRVQDTSESHPAGLRLGLDVELVRPTPSPLWPQVPGMSGALKQQGRSSPSERAGSPVIPCTRQAQVRSAVSASHPFRMPSLKTSGE